MYSTLYTDYCYYDGEGYGYLYENVQFIVHTYMKLFLCVCKISGQTTLKIQDITVHVNIKICLNMKSYVTMIQ